MKTDLITSMAVLWSAAGILIADVRVARGADGDLADDLPQVLTPSRLPQRLDETPSTVTIIDRAMIEASGARRLVDVLRLAPGFQVGYKNNNLPTATYHGLSDEYARRVLLLLNGQRIFQYSRGVVEWNNLPIPLESIERIEVVRGPDAAVYGSNALQAVINIQTGSPAEYPGLSTRIAAGSGGVADGFLRYGGRMGAMDYTLSVSSVGDSGYPGVYDDRRKPACRSWVRRHFKPAANGNCKPGSREASTGFRITNPLFRRLRGIFQSPTTSRACNGGNPAPGTMNGR
ncbi:MAG: TonB-dependent receptor plug domain-containing protein [Candidatus Competibacteraceae bacterium]